MTASENDAEAAICARSRRGVPAEMDCAGRNANRNNCAIQSQVRRRYPRFTMNSNKLISGLVLFNLGVFFTIAAFLPRAGSYGYSNPIEQLINARLHWDIAILATFGSSLLSTGLVLLFTSRTTTAPK